jgi:murein DD-endopeptidase MepM/ murein hydrolase activator NlpD
LVCHAPAGTSVHCIESGVVQLVDPTQAGELEVRSDRDRVYRYGRLLPSSIRARPGDWVEAGQILGEVGAVGEPGRRGGEQPTLVVALLDDAGRRLDLYHQLLGLPDPIELVLDGPAGEPSQPPGRAEPSPDPDRRASDPIPAADPAGPTDDDDDDAAAFRAMVARPSRRQR